MSIGPKSDFPVQNRLPAPDSVFDLAGDDGHVHRIGVWRASGPSNKLRISETFQKTGELKRPTEIIRYLSVGTDAVLPMYTMRDTSSEPAAEWNVQVHYSGGGVTVIYAFREKVQALVFQSMVTGYDVVSYFETTNISITEHQQYTQLGNTFNVGSNPVLSGAGEVQFWRKMPPADSPRTIPGETAGTRPSFPSNLGAEQGEQGSISDNVYEPSISLVMFLKGRDGSCIMVKVDLSSITTTSGRIMRNTLILKPKFKARTTALVRKLTVSSNSPDRLEVGISEGKGKVPPLEFLACTSIRLEVRKCDTRSIERQILDLQMEYDMTKLASRQAQMANRKGLKLGTAREQSGGHTSSETESHFTTLVPIKRHQSLLEQSFDEMIDAVMEEFWVMWNQNWEDHIRTHADNPSTPSLRTSLDLPTASTQTGASLSNKRRRSDESNREEEGNDPGRPPDPPPSGSAGSRGRKFACPFRKHDPVVYCLADHKICAISSWPNTARLKEHLYRCHVPIFCPRCKTLFKTKAALDEHIMIAGADICEVRHCPRPEGVTPEQEKELRSRKKTSPGQSEEDKWSNIYSLLFPSEDTPSCYFEPILEPGRRSPDANDLDDLERYLRCQVPQLVRTSLDERARQLQRPLQVQLLGMVHEITQDCVEKACRQFKRSRDTELYQVQLKQPQEPKSRSRVMQVADCAHTLVEGSDPIIQNTEAQDQFAGIVFEDLDPESTDFLDNITRVPPQLEDGFEEFEITQHQQPQMVGAVRTELSDSGYGSVLCACCHNTREECSCVFDFDLEPFV